MARALSKWRNGAHRMLLGHPEKRQRVECRREGLLHMTVLAGEHQEAAKVCRPVRRQVQYEGRDTPEFRQPVIMRCEEMPGAVARELAIAEGFARREGLAHDRVEQADEPVRVQKLCQFTQGPGRKFSGAQIVIEQVAFEPVLKAAARFICDEVFKCLQPVLRHEFHLRGIKFAVPALDPCDQQPAFLRADRSEHVARKIRMQDIRHEHAPVFGKTIPEMGNVTTI
jgi:hypothetical protein